MSLYIGIAYEVVLFQEWLVFQVGHKRVFGIILAAFTAFNNIADFMGRCNNVVGWFDNTNRFMGTGGSEGGNQVTARLNLHFSRVVSSAILVSLLSHKRAHPTGPVFLHS